MTILAAALSGPVAVAHGASTSSPDAVCAADGRLFIGDGLTCLSPDQPDVRSNGRYQPQGPDFPIRGKYGTPAVPPDPRGDDCHPVTGSGSLSLPSPAQLYTDANGRKVSRVVASAHGHTGYGAGGFFSIPLDIYVNPDGTGGFVGRETFEGTIDGRTGAMVHWFEGTFDASGNFVGSTYTIRGMEGLAGIQHKAYVAGVFNKGYEWVDGVYCWNGFNGMYDDNGNLIGN